MKFRHAAAVSAMATGALAQSMSAAPTSYTTVTFSDCPESSVESLITVTNGVTVTYCPECEMASSASGHTTVYTTTYLSLCPTGLVPATYTVTESCSEATPTYTPGPEHIPQGFTVTTKQCTVCAETPTAVTITEPCGCEATNGVPVTNSNAATTPAAAPGGGSGNVLAVTTPAAGADSGSPSYTKGSMPAAGSNGAAAPYPTTVTHSCPGPQCRAGATSYPSGVSYGNTTGIVPSAGAASSLSSMGALSVLLATAIAALAFSL